jgi:hypothetical protein
MSSISKLGALQSRIPAILLLMTLGLGALTAIPTAILGGRESLPMMMMGAGVGLGIVLAGSFCARLALRGPDRFGVKIVVGGLVFRLALLGLLLTAIVRLARFPLESFILWMVFFYFSLVMAEAWLLARQAVAPASREMSPR